MVLVNPIIQHFLIEPDLIEEIRLKYRFEKNRRSFDKRENYLIGKLGEWIVKQKLAGSIESNSYDYDLLYNGKKIEVKFKRCNSVPRLNYDVSVADISRDIEMADYFVFGRIREDLTEGWILGYCSYLFFLKYSVNMVEGQIDLSNNYSVKTSCRNLKIFELDDFENLKRLRAPPVARNKLIKTLWDFWHL